MFLMFFTCTVLRFMVEQLHNRINVSIGKPEIYKLYLVIPGFHE